MRTIFNPRPEVIKVFQTWGTEPDLHNPQLLNIQSSLGAIMQMLWSKEAAGRNARMVLADTATTTTLYHTATFALWLLSCRQVQILYRFSLARLHDRTAELKSHIANGLVAAERSTLSGFYPTDDISDSFWFGRGRSRWLFTSQWCTHLIRAPLDDSLLDLLHHLVSNCLLAPPEEIDRLGIVSWLRVSMFRVFHWINTDRRTAISARHV
jgi:hypothetical protein